MSARRELWWLRISDVKLVQRFRVGKNIVRAEAAKAKAAAEAAKAASQTPAGGAQPAKADASKGDK